MMTGVGTINKWICLSRWIRRTELEHTEAGGQNSHPPRYPDLGHWETMWQAFQIYFSAHIQVHRQCADLELNSEGF